MTPPDDPNQEDDIVPEFTCTTHTIPRQTLSPIPTPQPVLVDGYQPHISFHPADGSIIVNSGKALPCYSIGTDFVVRESIPPQPGHLHAHQNVRIDNHDWKLNHRDGSGEPGRLDIVAKDGTITHTQQAPERGVLSWGISKFAAAHLSPDGTWLVAAIRGEAGYGENKDKIPNQLRIQLFHADADWRVVSEIDLPDPSHARHMDALFLPTGQARRLAFKIEGNWASHLSWITWDNDQLNALPAPQHDGPLPYLCGPVTSPNGTHYLIGDGTFRHGVTKISYPDCRKRGLLQWPGIPPESKGLSLGNSLYLDDQHALVRSQNRLFLFNTETMIVTRELVLPSHDNLTGWLLTPDRKFVTTHKGVNVQGYTNNEFLFFDPASFL